MQCVDFITEIFARTRIRRPWIGTCTLQAEKQILSRSPYIAIKTV